MDHSWKLEIHAKLLIQPAWEQWIRWLSQCWCICCDSSLRKVWAALLAERARCDSWKWCVFVVCAWISKWKKHFKKATTWLLVVWVIFGDEILLPSKKLTNSVMKKIRARTEIQLAFLGLSRMKVIRLWLARLFMWKDDSWLEIFCWRLFVCVSRTLLGCVFPHLNTASSPLKIISTIISCFCFPSNTSSLLGTETLWHVYLPPKKSSETVRNLPKNPRVRSDDFVAQIKVAKLMYKPIAICFDRFKVKIVMSPETWELLDEGLMGWVIWRVGLSWGMVCWTLDVLGIFWLEKLLRC